MKILITGAAGNIGSILVKGLKVRHTLRGFDHVASSDLDDFIVGDITDLDALVEAAEGMEAMIHLAGSPAEETPWEDVLPNNIIGTYNALEAARRSCVRRFAFASRAGFLRTYPPEVVRTIDMMPRPQDYYSVSKIYGESLGYVYSSRFGLEFVAVRIGNIIPDRPGTDHPHHLSHADAVRVFEQAVTHSGVKYEIVFGVSGSKTWQLYDLDHGRDAIGYESGDQSAASPEL